MNYFSLDVQNASTNKGVVEGQHYVVIKDGNGMKHRVLNFDNKEICKRKGIIELEAVNRSSRHENYMAVSRIIDRDNDIIIGIPTGVDNKTKDLKFQRIVLRDEHVFDLTKPADAKMWAVLKHHKDIDVDGSKTRAGLKPKYKVYDKEREAEQFHINRNFKRRAVDIAEQLQGIQLRDTAITLGLEVDMMSITQMSMKVIQEAEHNPKRFLEVWDSPGRSQLTVIKKGISCGVLTHDPLLGICYNGLPLGQAEPQAIEFLKNNIQVCNTIQQLVSTKEADTLNNMESEGQGPVIHDEKDAETKRLKAELEELKAQMKKIAESNIKEIADETAKQIIQNDPEFAELIERAKGKVQGYALIKNKEILRKKVEEAEEKERLRTEGGETK